MSNILRKINKNNGNGIISIRKEKKFLECVQNTMLDFEYAYNNGYREAESLLNSLKNILETKKLILTNVMELIQLIESTKAKSLENPTQVDMEIYEEQSYMESVLSKYFTWTENLGMYAISYKDMGVA